MNYLGSPTFATFSVPISAYDAQRTEALGPALGSLLVSTLNISRVIFIGDSKYVVGLINREFHAHEMFLYNCIQLVFDLLYPIHCRAQWIGRDFN